MRIVHVITRMILGGAQENTMLSCEGLIRMGHDVTLVTGPTAGPEGELLAECARRGVPVVEVPHLVRAVSPWRDLQAYRALKRKFAEMKPDVAHTHSSKAGFLGRLAARAAGVPVVVHTIHGLPFHPYMNAALRRAYVFAERFAAKRCDRIVSVADAMTNQAVAAGVAPREKFVTVYSGMEVGPFLRARELRDETRRRLGYLPGDFVIVKVARLFELKGHGYVLDAAREVAAALPQARFLFVGDGVLHRSLELRARRLGIAERVKFAGLVPASEIPAHLAAADLLVHASLREGLPRAVPQALLAGTPAVVFDVDGTREAIRDNETGLLVAPRDVDGLARAILRMACEPGLARRTAEAGRDLAARLFPVEAMTSRLDGIYSGLQKGRIR